MYSTVIVATFKTNGYYTEQCMFWNVPLTHGLPTTWYEYIVLEPDWKVRNDENDSNSIPNGCGNYQGFSFQGTAINCKNNSNLISIGLDFVC